MNFYKNIIYKYFPNTSLELNLLGSLDIRKFTIFSKDSEDFYSLNKAPVVRICGV